jgi:hypothetical protein
VALDNAESSRVALERALNEASNSSKALILSELRAAALEDDKSELVRR